MSSSISFLGKTAIITGAGGALGRSYALDLAKRGCNLLLNDIGATLIGTVDAEKRELTSAEKLVAEINANGGKAVFSSHSVASHGDKIVEQALSNFGRCDIVINNAGNLRDKSFSKMTKEDWHSVLDVHLNGTFSMCHAAWPVFQEQKYGRIINIGSGAGLYGNFGQANYSSAKMGILGLTQTLAKEGAKNNIFANCVVPVASSRMTETVLPQEVLRQLDPALVAPIVTFLAHESTTNNGECFEVGGGWYSKIRIERSSGVFLGNQSTPATAELIALNMSNITDFSQNSSHPLNAGDAFLALMAAKDRIGNGGVNLEKATSSIKVQAISNVSLQSDVAFTALQTLLSTDKAASARLKEQCRTRVVFSLIDEKTKSAVKNWYLDFKKDEPSISEISLADIEILKPSAVLTCTDQTVINLMKGKLGPEMAYFRGLLKIQGSMGAATRIKSLLELSSSLKL